jgi:hypothetical protein
LDRGMWSLANCGDADALGGTPFFAMLQADDMIRIHNSGAHTYSVAHNKFSALSMSEFSDRFLKFDSSLFGSMVCVLPSMVWYVIPKHGKCNRIRCVCLFDVSIPLLWCFDLKAFIA